MESYQYRETGDSNGTDSSPLTTFPMEAIRAKRKSPQEKQRELQKRTRSQLKAEIVRLKQELQQKDEKIAQLELKLFSPTPSLKRGDNRSWR